MTRYSKQNTDLSGFIKNQKTSGLATYNRPKIEAVKQPQNKNVVTVESLMTRNTAKICNVSVGL